METKAVGQEVEQLNASLFAEPYHVDMAYTTKDCHIDWQAELKEDGTMTINKGARNERVL